MLDELASSPDIVIVCPEATELIPSPAVTVSVWESNATVPVPVSPAIDKSVAIPVIELIILYFVITKTRKIIKNYKLENNINIVDNNIFYSKNINNNYELG